jgi:hypothetical protein
MPLPTSSDAHVNRPLTNISVATIQDARNFIASRAFPIVPVQKQSDAYFSYDNAYWNRDEMQVRAPATESEGGGYAIDGTNTYFCPIRSIHKDIPDELRANADVPINLDSEATKYVTLKALIKREILFAAAYMAGSVWTYDYDGVSESPGTSEVLQWNDASSTPIEDVWAAKESILQLTGFEPNKLILGYPVYRALINHPDIVDRVKYGQTPGRVAMVDVTELAQVFKVDEVLVSRGIKNTALEGASSATHSFINGKNALLVYAPPSPGVMTPSGGYIFTWTGYLGAGPEGNRILRMRADLRHCDRVEIEIAFDMKKISADLGAFWDSVVA